MKGEKHAIKNTVVVKMTHFSGESSRWGVVCGDCDILSDVLVKSEIAIVEEHFFPPMMFWIPMTDTRWLETDLVSFSHNQCEEPIWPPHKKTDGHQIGP